MNLAHEVLRAAERLQPHLKETPLEPSRALGAATGTHTFLKLENLQPTGSFKVRGALHKILTLSDEERARGVVAASTGNHGAATAFAMDRLGVGGVVFVTENASSAKVQAIERLGAEIVARGGDCLETEAHARGHAIEHGMVYLSPYNDAMVVAGQGTTGFEIARQLDSVDAVIASVGGGGLISGIAGYLKSVHPNVRIIGASPENSKVMIESVRAGEILDLSSSPTLSDGTAGGVEAGSITFELCRDLVDEFVTIPEEEIAASLREFLQVHHLLIEGAAAVALAAHARVAARFAGRNVVVVICGANIGLDTLRSVL